MSTTIDTRQQRPRTARARSKLPNRGTAARWIAAVSVTSVVALVILGIADPFMQMGYRGYVPGEFQVLPATHAAPILVGLYCSVLGGVGLLAARAIGRGRIVAMGVGSAPLIVPTWIGTMQPSGWDQAVAVYPKSLAVVMIGVTATHILLVGTSVLTLTVLDERDSDSWIRGETRNRCRSSFAEAG